MVGPGAQPRATRFPIETPVLYRASGEDSWRRGRSVNVSRTGVLVDAEDKGLGMDAGAEFVLALPPAGGGAGANVECRGRVARSESTGTTARAACGGRFALTIDDHWFVPGLPGKADDD